MIPQATAGLLALAVAATAAATADDGWRLDKDQDGVKVYSRAVDGWNIREIRGDTRVTARLSALVAVLDDIPAQQQLNDLVRESRITERTSPTRYRYYATTHMPWPLSDRDIVNERTIAQDPGTLAVAVVTEAIAGAMEPRKGFVRIDKSRHAWELTPQGNGEVRVSMRMLADPNGPIPSSLINAMSVDVPFKMLRNLGALAQQAPYASAQLPFIHEPSP